MSTESWDIKVPLTKGLKDDQFLNVMEAVENEGGELLTGACRGVKTGLQNIDSLGRKIVEPIRTTGCGNQSRFAVPLIAVEGQDGGTAEQPAVVCAVDDAMHYWPRYKDAV